MATILQFPIKVAACHNCRFWTRSTNDGPRGICLITDDITDQGYWCAKHDRERKVLPFEPPNGPSAA